MSLEHILGLRCVQCGTSHGVEVRYTCPACGPEGILDVEYDEARVARTMTRAALEGRPPTLWRYQELLPVSEASPLPFLRVGMSPVYDVPRLAAAVGVRRLVLKDEGRNPTGSFKDRSSAVGVVKAQEFGHQAIACASTGNAASSLAGFAAAVGLQSFIFVPERAPEPKLAQLLAFGATVLRVKGSYDAAYAFCQEACARYGWYNRNCAVNPYLIEGKKTVGLELAEQLGAALPDWVVFSVGDGCTLAGAWKGLSEMHRLGFLPKLPRMLGVQAAGASSLAEQHRTGAAQPKALEARTLADAIAVGRPRNWRKALRALRESQGAMVVVEDAEILEALVQTGRLGAVFAEPAAAAAVAGLSAAVKQGLVGRAESALVVLTGSGLKDVRSALDAAPPPLDVPLEPAALETALRERRLI